MEIKKSMEKSDNILFFDKHELESLKKITKTIKISDYEVLTDDGFVDIESLHETIPYEVYHLKLSDGKYLKCADNHIVFDENMSEVFVKNLKVGSKILVETEGVLDKSEVIELTNLGYQEVMYDLELMEGSNRRYYTNGILSHNTLLAKELAKQIFGSDENLIRVDMSEYQDKHTVSRLIGAPPGYVGYDEGGQLTEQVKTKPYSVVLFDEVEKAHKDIFSALLQLLDEGYMTDSFGRKINFKNCLIIMTSNLGVKKMQEFGAGVGFSKTGNVYTNEELKKTMLNKELKNHFAPEFINRLDEVIVFNTLQNDDIQKIVLVEVNKLKSRLSKLGYNINFGQSVIDFVSKVGFDDVYGARPLKRAIQEKIEDYISDEVLREKILMDKSYNIEINEEEVSISEVEVQPDETSKVKRPRKKKGE
jgi:hypothetical protein